MHSSKREKSKGSSHEPLPFSVPNQTDCFFAVWYCMEKAALSKSTKSAYKNLVPKVLDLSLSLCYNRDTKTS